MSATLQHPGDRRLSELGPEQRSEIARAWGATENEAAAIFDSMSLDTRWEILCTLPGRDGSNRAELSRIADSVDSETNAAFDALYEVDDDADPYDDRWGGPFGQLKPNIQAGIELAWGLYGNEARERFDAMNETERFSALAELSNRRARSTSGTVPEAPGLFRRRSMAELMAEPDEFEWLVRGLLAQPTYGQIAGEMKTLKSYVDTFITVGVASGVPIFGYFTPERARPVLAYVGEGGRRLWKRRLRRICAAMGVNPDELDVHPTFDVAPIQSLVFQESLHRDLDEVRPGLVTLDPLYAYHGSQTRAADLHQEGDLLNQLSSPCMAADASLVVVNHYNQTGSGSSLKRITQAGSGEWADSWVLIEHRETPDVEHGVFWLTLEIGSRQWGGTTWDLDIDIGRFDIDSGSHDGEITWDLNRASAGAAKKAGSGAKDRARIAILDALTDMPWQMTKTALKVTVGGDRKAFAAALDELVDEGRICHDQVSRTESGVTKSRPLWGLKPTRADENRPGWNEECD